MWNCSSSSTAADLVIDGTADADILILRNAADPTRFEIELNGPDDPSGPSEFDRWLAELRRQHAPRPAREGEEP